MIVFELGDDDAEAAPAPAIADDAAGDDEERTLTELDAVPTIDDTMVVSRAELEALAGTGNGREPHGRRRVSRAVIAVVAATAVVVFAALVVWTLSRSYFVGVQPDGHVAVYQGFPWNIVGGVRLYRIRYESPVLAGQLSQAERRNAVRPRPAHLRPSPRRREAVRGAGRPVSVRTESRARQPRRGRHHHRPRLRERLHRAPVGDLGRLGLVRADLPRPLPGRARRHPLHGPLGRPVPASAGRTADRDRADRDLPPRVDRCLQAGLLDRRRRRRVRTNADPASRRLPRARELQVPVRRLGGRTADAARTARHRHDHQRRPPLGEGRADPVPAGRAGQDRADRLPRRLPAREARGARPGQAEGLRAAAPDLGRRRCSCSSRPTTSAARSSTSGSSWRCCTSPPDGRSSSRSGSCSSSAVRRPRTRRSRACRSASTSG